MAEEAKFNIRISLSQGSINSALMYLFRGVHPKSIEFIDSKGELADIRGAVLTIETLGYEQVGISRIDRALERYCNIHISHEGDLEPGKEETVEDKIRTDSELHGVLTPSSPSVITMVGNNLEQLAILKGKIGLIEAYRLMYPFYKHLDFTFKVFVAKAKANEKKRKYRIVDDEYVEVES